MFPDTTSIRCEVQCISADRMADADNALRFVQHTFEKLDLSIEQLPHQQRQAFKAVLARHLANVLAEVQYCVAITKQDLQDVMPAGSRADRTAPLKVRAAKVIHEWNEIADYYHKYI